MIVPKKTRTNTTPEPYERFANTLSRTSGVRPSRVRRNWCSANRARTGTEPASSARAHAGQPSSRPWTSG
ncbi:hypothetical protein [Spirillospora sp. CA-128828]|uniref:hypothetical protein n=1 Tax=Spirillospora sp. CA-128828 TaxID=3240033 RepID=UPI003D8A8ABC